jgi:gas vesicle protein
MCKDDCAKVGAAFLVGGAIGAVIALLYAPKSGKETRKDITRTARKIKHEAQDFIEDAVDQVEDFVDGTKERVTDIINKGTDLSSSAKKEIIKTLEQGQKALEKQKTRIVESIGG